MLAAGLDRGIRVKVLIASIGLNVLLAAAVGTLLLHDAAASTRPQDAHPGVPASANDDTPAVHRGDLSTSGSSEAPCAAPLARCRDEDLPRCLAEVAALGRRVAETDARDLERLFEGGEPNPQLAERVRSFFSPLSTVECHDVVCRIDEPGDDGDLRGADEKRMGDPYYRALESAVRLSAGPDGSVERLLRVADGATLDGQRVLDLWLLMRGPDAIVACGAEQAGEHTVSASIDAEGRIGLEAVRGSDKASCLQERLQAARPGRGPIATRPARVDRPLPNPFAPSGASGAPPPATTR